MEAQSDREIRHRQLLERYQELLRKYEDATQRRAHGSTLSDWLLRNTSDGVLLVEGQRALAANPRFVAWNAAHPDWYDQNAPASPETLLSLVCRLVEADPTSEPSVCRLRPHRLPEPVLEVSTYPLGKPGEMPRTVVLLRDVTQQEAWQRDQEQSGCRDRFLGTLAHELRNPLASITTAAELLQTSSDPKVRRAAEVIQRQSRQQARMIEDLLDVSRVREGKLTLRLETVDLRVVVHEAIEATEPQRRCGPRLEQALPEAEIWVEGDRSRLVQAVSNLLANAARFTPKEGVNAIAAGDADGIAWVRVSDNGPGISPEALPRLWELFYQEAAATGAQPGLGIGLALVKKLMELHGGGLALLRLAWGMARRLPSGCPSRRVSRRLRRRSVHRARPRRRSGC